MIGCHIIIPHYNPFHIDIRHVYSIEQLLGMLERPMLVALGVYLYNCPAECDHFKEVVQKDGVDRLWAGSNTWLHLREGQEQNMLIDLFAI